MKVLFAAAALVFSISSFAAFTPEWLTLQLVQRAMTDKDFVPLGQFVTELKDITKADSQVSKFATRVSIHYKPGSPSLTDCFVTQYYDLKGGIVDKNYFLKGKVDRDILHLESGCFGEGPLIEE